MNANLSTQLTTTLWQSEIAERAVDTVDWWIALSSHISFLLRSKNIYVEVNQTLWIAHRCEWEITSPVLYSTCLITLTRHFSYSYLHFQLPNIWLCLFLSLLCLFFLSRLKSTVLRTIHLVYGVVWISTCRGRSRGFSLMLQQPVCADGWTRRRLCCRALWLTHHNVPLGTHDQY